MNLRLATTLTLVAALTACANPPPESKSEACIDHPPYTGFQEKSSKVCTVLYAPSCVNVKHGQTSFEALDAALDEKAKPYRNSQYLEFTPDGQGTTVETSQTPKNCVFEKNGDYDEEDEGG